MGVEVLEDVKVSEVAVLGVRLALGGACLKGLHLGVNDMGWSDLTSACYELESGVERYGGEGGDGKGADDWGAESACHAMN